MKLQLWAFDKRVNDVAFELGVGRWKCAPLSHTFNGRHTIKSC